MVTIPMYTECVCSLIYVYLEILMLWLGDAVDRTWSCKEDDKLNTWAKRRIAIAIYAAITLRAFGVSKTWSRGWVVERLSTWPYRADTRYRSRGGASGGARGGARAGARGGARDSARCNGRAINLTRSDKLYSLSCGRESPFNTIIDWQTLLFITDCLLTDQPRRKAFHDILCRDDGWGRLNISAIIDYGRGNILRQWLWSCSGYLAWGRAPHAFSIIRRRYGL